MDEGGIVKLVNLIQEDFTNYKYPSMFLGFPYCTGKCNLSNKHIVCQNQELQNAEKIEISIPELLELYKKNNISKAVVCGGLEPFDSPVDLIHFVESFRKISNDDIVIYTGYEEDEPQAGMILQNIKALKVYNVIVKFGRYIEGDEPHYDEILGVNLASNNQYAEKVS